MADHRFYVGPVGGLVALPDQLTDVDASQVRGGGTHAGLGGGGVADLQRILGTWSWSWEQLLPHQVVFAKSLHNGLVRGPLRLVDPREANRLPIQFASGGSQRRSPTGAVVSSGSVAHRPLTAAPASPTSLPVNSLSLRGAFAWSVPQSVGGSLGVTRAATVGPSALGASSPWRVPLLLADGTPERIQLSCWACVDITDSTDSTDPVSVSWSREDRDAAGTSTLAAGKAVVLSGQRWTRVSWTFTPPRTAVDSSPSLAVAGGGPACTVYVTAAMWSALDAESLPPTVRFCDTTDPGAGWRTGGGAPEVTVPEIGGHGYGLLPLHSLGLRLVER